MFKVLYRITVGANILRFMCFSPAYILGKHSVEKIHYYKNMLLQYQQKLDAMIMNHRV